MVDDLASWNKDRVRSGKSVACSYSGLLRHSVNRLSEAVLGRTVITSHASPRKYTGKLTPVLIDTFSFFFVNFLSCETKCKNDIQIYCG